MRQQQERAQPQLASRNSFEFNCTLTPANGEPVPHAATVSIALTGH